MIKASVVKAIGHDDETLDEYEYDHPLDEIGKDCLRLFMEFMNILYDVKSFSTINYHDGVGEKFTPGKPQKGDLF